MLNELDCLNTLHGLAERLDELIPSGILWTVLAWGFLAVTAFRYGGRAAAWTASGSWRAAKGAYLWLTHVPPPPPEPELPAEAQAIVEAIGRSSWHPSGSPNDWSELRSGRLSVRVAGDGLAGFDSAPVRLGDKNIWPTLDERSQVAVRAAVARAVKAHKEELRDLERLEILEALRGSDPGKKS